MVNLAGMDILWSKTHDTDHDDFRVSMDLDIGTFSVSYVSHWCVRL